MDCCLNKINLPYLFKSIPSRNGLIRMFYFLLWCLSSQYQVRKRDILQHYCNILLNKIRLIILIIKLN